MNKWLKWILIGLGFVILVLSQGRELHQNIFYFFDFQTEPSKFELFLYSLFSGLFSLVNKIINFLLSWEGVLLLGVLVLYFNTKQCNEKNDN